MSNNDDRPESGVGSPPIQRQPEAPAGPKPDNEGNIWKPYKPGFEINQKGQLRTTDHQPPEPPSMIWC